MSSEHIEKITEITAEDLFQKWAKYNGNALESFKAVVMPLIRNKQKDEAVLDKVDLAHERLDMHKDSLNEVEAVLEGLLELLEAWHRRKDL